MFRSANFCTIVIIIQKAFVAALQRIVNNFSMEATDRYLQFRDQYPGIEQRVPQYMVCLIPRNYQRIFEQVRSKITMQRKSTWYGPGNLLI